MVYEGNQKLGDLFISRREKGKSGLPTLSVTLTDGLVNRKTLERKTDTNLAENEHLLVKGGDIAYNMMRMWQSDDDVIAVDSGSIDRKDVQQKIIDIMEGGPEAFDRRKTIYQLWNSAG